MLKKTIVPLFLLMSLSSSAQIELKVGDSITLNGVPVSCGGAPIAVDRVRYINIDKKLVFAEALAGVGSCRVVLEQISLDSDKKGYFIKINNTRASKAYSDDYDTAVSEMDTILRQTIYNGSCG
tara:strand:+ start:4602 stop:4973 length:372 start_codon:yes stop_codon:yes gene_type:complete